MNYNKWTTQEEDYLKNNHNIKTLQEMERDLNRTFRTISEKIGRMGLILGERKCRQCNGEFQPSNRGQIICSKHCHGVRHYHKNIEYQRARGKKNRLAQSDTLPRKVMGWTEKKKRLIFEKYRNHKGSFMDFSLRYGLKSSSMKRLLKVSFPDEYDEAVEKRKSGCSQYKKGRVFEYRVRDDKKRQGYFVLRSPMSKSPVDLVAIKHGAVEFIQCKTSREYFRQDERKTLIELAESVGTIPVLAYRGKGGIYRYPIIYEILRNR